MLKIAKDDPTEWDSWLPYLLFAYREVPNESTGFSPFELLFGRHVRGPLDILKESWEAESKSSESVVSYVLKMRERISQTMEVAKLSEKQKEEMELLLEEFNDVLQDKPGRIDMAEHSIETGTETPVRQLPYRIPYAQREEMMKEVQRMEEMGVVQPSKSDWASPVVMVPKKDGTHRFCEDFAPFRRVKKKDSIHYTNWIT